MLCLGNNSLAGTHARERHGRSSSTPFLFPVVRPFTSFPPFPPPQPPFPSLPFIYIASHASFSLSLFLFRVFLPTHLLHLTAMRLLLLVRWDFVYHLPSVSPLPFDRRYTHDHTHENTHTHPPSFSPSPTPGLHLPLFLSLPPLPLLPLSSRDCRLPTQHSSQGLPIPRLISHCGRSNDPCVSRAKRVHYCDTWTDVMICVCGREGEGTIRTLGRYMQTAWPVPGASEARELTIATPEGSIDMRGDVEGKQKGFMGEYMGKIEMGGEFARFGLRAQCRLGN